MKRVLLFIVAISFTGFSWSQRDTTDIIKQGIDFINAKEYDKAFNIFSKAANEGNSHAQNAMGKLYYEGIGVNKDDSIALQWFRKSAEQGYAGAQNNLGVMYEYGYKSSRVV